MRSTECVLCANDLTKDVKVLPWPIPASADMDGYGDVGASMGRFRRMPDEARVIALLSEGIWMVEKRGFAMERVFAALMQIDECRAALEADPFRVL